MINPRCLLPSLTQRGSRQQSGGLAASHRIAPDIISLSVSSIRDRRKVRQKPSPCPQVSSVWETSQSFQNDGNNEDI